MSDRFAVCMPITAKWEGAYVNHAQDPGGPTNLGVTQAVYDAWRKRRRLAPRSVKQITHGEALRIYRDEYWAPTAERYNLRPGVDLATFDAGVNAGVSRGIKWLLASIGGPDHVTVQKICKARLSFKQGLSIWKTFGNGWTNRVVDIEAKGVAMALAAVNDNSAAVQEKLEDEGRKANDTANKQSGSAGGAGAASGGGVTLDPASADQLAGWLLTGAIAAGVLVAAFLIWRAVINKKRAKAYAAAAAEVQP